MDAQSRNLAIRANDKFRKLCQISTLLNTGLTPAQVHLCQRLIDKGVNPEALAHSIDMIQKEMKKLQQL